MEQSFLVYSEQYVSVDLTSAEQTNTESETAVGNEAEQKANADRPIDDQKPPQSEPRDGDMSGLKVGGWVSLGVGAAALIGGAVTGGLALSKYSDLKEACPGGTCYTEQYGEMDAKDSLATASTVLLAVGGTAAAVGAGLLIYRQLKLKLKKKHESSAVSWFVVPNGLIFQGRF